MAGESPPLNEAFNFHSELARRLTSNPHFIEEETKVWKGYEVAPAHAADKMQSQASKLGPLILEAMLTTCAVNDTISPLPVGDFAGW